LLLQPCLAAVLAMLKTAAPAMVREDAWGSPPLGAALQHGREIRLQMPFGHAANTCLHPFPWQNPGQEHHEPVPAADPLSVMARAVNGQLEALTQLGGRLHHGVNTCTCIDPIGA
jgi:hypothetical protein